MPLHSLRLQTCRSEAGLQQQQAALYGGGWTALKLFDVLPCSRGTVRDASFGRAITPLFPDGVVGLNLNERGPLPPAVLFFLCCGLGLGAPSHHDT